MEFNNSEHGISLQLSGLLVPHLSVPTFEPTEMDLHSLFNGRIHVVFHRIFTEEDFYWESSAWNGESWNATEE